MFEHTVETLKQLEGATIQKIAPQYAWHKPYVDGIILTLSKEGNTFEIWVTAHSQKGCEQCDEDGSGIDYLEVDQY